MAHILIIDDDEDLRRFLEDILRNDGHTVSTASDGCEALRIFNDSVDLVITDVLMPRMGGLQTIDFLRKRAPGLPIISISGGGRIGAKDYLDVATLIGANRTLVKPFFDWELLEAVAEFVPVAPAMALTV